METEEKVEQKPAETVLEKVKKNDIKKWLIVAVAGLALVLVVLGVTQAAVIKNTAAKLFMNPQKYYQHVVKNDIENMTEGMAVWYSGMIKESANIEDRSASFAISAGVDDTLLDSLNELTYEEWDFLKNLALEVGISRKDAIMQFKADASADEEVLANVTLLLDQPEKQMYFQFPQLTETYLASDMETLLSWLLGKDEASVQEDMEALEEGINKMQILYEKLPNHKEFKKLLSKYLVLAMSCIEDVEEGTDVLTVNNVSANCTKLELVLDEDTLQSMVETVLEAVEEDKELEQIILDVLSVQNEVDGSDVYDMFLDLVSELLDETEYLTLDEDIELCIWVDKTGSICGGSIEYNDYYGKAEASYAIVRNGKKVGINAEVKVGDMKIRVNGDAAKRGKKLSGELNVKAAGVKFATISFSDVVFEKDHVKGCFNFTPEKYIVELLDGELGDYFPVDLDDLAVQWNVEYTLNRSYTSIALMEDEERLVFLDALSETGKGLKVSVPDQNDCVYAETEEDLLVYVDTLEVDNLLENLEDAGFPEGTLGSVERTFFSMQYEQAITSYENWEYEKALSQLEKLAKSDICKEYYYYELAINDDITACNYQLAVACMEKKDYAKARQYFELTDGYADTELQLLYIEAEEAYQKQDYETAMYGYEQIVDLYDSSLRYQECAYAIALEYKDQEQYEEALDYFLVIDAYKDSEEQATDCAYQLAIQYKDNEEYQEAIYLLEMLGDYEDSESLLAECTELLDGQAVFRAYDLGGVTITLLDCNSLYGTNPDAYDIDYYTMYERQEHVDYIEEKYNVNLEYVTSETLFEDYYWDWNEYENNIVSAYESGRQVDVMMDYYEVMDILVAEDIFYDMSDAFAKTGTFKNTALYSWSDGQWGVSRPYNSEGLYYNKTWIEELGMEYTPAEMFDMGMWDYDNCYEYLKEMKSKMAEDDYPIYVAPYYWGLWATHANGVKIWQDDGRLGYTNEYFLETMEFLQKLIDEDIAAIPEIVGQNDAGLNSYNNWGFPGATFDAGEKVAIAHRADWQAAGLVDKFELGYVPYPWGSNVSLDESLIGQSGAYLTLDDNYMGSYYDGEVIALTKGIEQKADPIAVMTMVAELVGWDSVMKNYVPEEDMQDCGWLEEGIDEDLFFFTCSREAGESYNATQNILFELPWTRMIYEKMDVRETCENYYQVDMAAMLETGYCTEDMLD